MTGRACWRSISPGHFLCAQAAGPTDARQRRRRYRQHSPPYRACAPRPCAPPTAQAKAGLAHLTQQQAVELASLGHPGQCRRTRSGRYRHGEGRPFAGDPRRLSRRHSAPTATGLEEELAEAIFFLCSARASYITDRRLPSMADSRPQHWPAGPARGRAQHLAALALKALNKARR